MGQLLTGLKEMQETIARLTGQVRSHSEYVFDSTRQLVSGNQDLSSRTEHQASTVEEASATVEELSATGRRPPLIIPRAGYFRRKKSRPNCDGFFVCSA
jgi:methyl-accepting chemotaxis protein